jgi:urease accessory protein
MTLFSGLNTTFFSLALAVSYKAVLHKPISKSREAKLELVFAEQDGRIRISKQFASSPLKIWRPFELDPGRVLVQIVNVSPGVLAGDNYSLELTVQAGANVVLVNQSATKLHSMRQGKCAKQTTNIHIEDDAELEYYPGLTIPFPDAEYSQRITVQLAKTAKFAMLESWAMGRTARGELHAFRKISSRIRVTREDRLVYSDGLELALPNLGVGILDGYSYLANGVWCWGNVAPSTESSTPKDDPLVIGQATHDVTYLRALAKDGLELKKRLHEKVNIWREQAGMDNLEFSRFTS